MWKGFGDKETHSKYEGDIENGKPNGLGFVIYTNGEKYVGSWKDGGIWNGTLYDTNGKILHKIVNGEIQSL